jgi:hypothetical protein
MDIFVDVLKDRKNFLDDKTWNNKDIPPLSLSKQGINALNTGLEGDLKPIYNSGMAGMDMPFLTYFLTQLIVSISAIRQRLEIQDMEEIDKKFPKIKNINIKGIYNSLEGKNYESPKSTLMRYLEEYKKLFQGSSELTDKDIALIRH